MVLGVESRAPGDGAPENLYLVTRTGGGPFVGEYFERAIIYAESGQRALIAILDYIDLLNEAETADQESGDAGDGDGPITCDPGSIGAVLLATNVGRPDEAVFDADGILIFETGWTPPD